VRIFLDANVIFAATISPDGACAALLDVCQALVHDVVTSGFAFEEAGTNVRLKRPECQERLAECAGLLGRVPEAPFDLVVAATDIVGDKDAPILAAGVHAGAALLVSGDRRHFGGVIGRSWSGIEVVTPRGALERLTET
jgi:uncharacterized protein